MTLSLFSGLGAPVIQHTHSRAIYYSLFISRVGVIFVRWGC